MILSIKKGLQTGDPHKKNPKFWFLLFSILPLSPFKSSQAVNSSVGATANVTGLVGLAGATTASPHFHSYSYNQLNPQVDGAGIGLVTNLVGGIVGSAGLIPTAFSATQPAATCQRISPAAELQSEKV